MSVRWTEDQFRAHQQRAGVGAAAARAPMAVRHARRAKGMNKTEAAYAQQLELRLRAGEIHWYGFERLKLRLADNTFYTPDFAVLAADGVLEFHEVKGFWEDDARVKIKVAAAQYPFRFIAVSKRKARHGAGWNVEVFR